MGERTVTVTRDVPVTIYTCDAAGCPDETPTPGDPGWLLVEVARPDRARGLLFSTPKCAAAWFTALQQETLAPAAEPAALDGAAG